MAHNTEIIKLNYLSKFSGIGGTIKTVPEDFIVEEIAEDGTIFEIDKKVEKPDQLENAKFIHFILQKTDWSTSDAIKTIAKKLRISFKRFNFAGTKDKTAVTTQLVSCFAVKKEEIENLDIRDMKILSAWYAHEKVNLGDLLGNRFTIKVENPNENSEEIVTRIYQELNGKVPNYFGEQRFGSTRRNTHIIGEKILRGRLKDAAMTFLCDSEGEENEQARLARKELHDSEDFEQASNSFPKYLRLERSMISCLAENPKDYANAFRRLPRNNLLLFVHAFQSYLFNVILSEKIKEKDLEENGSLVGYETNLSEEEKNLLEKFEIRKEDFKIKFLPEISSRGTKRKLLVELKDFSFKNNMFKFSLPAGSYATVALREFLDVKK